MKDAGWRWSERRPRRASEIKLDVNRPRDGFEIVFGKRAKLPQKPSLRDGGDLVGHGFPAFTCDVDIGFRGIEAAHLAGNRHDLEPVQQRVRGVVAEDDRWAGLLDFTADGRI